MAKKAKRTAIGRSTKSPASKQVKTKIHSDPEKEYAKAVSQKGMVQILHMTDDDCLMHVKDFLPSGNIELDRLLHGRGIPFGRITEIYGPNHIGKSTTLDHFFRMVQREGGTAILADTELARDLEYTRAIGVDVTKLLVMELDRDQLTMENILTKILETINWWRTNYPDRKVVIGWDSLGGTQTNEERDKEVSKGKSPGSAASIMQLMRRKVTPDLAHSNIALVILNHEYEKINTTKFAGKKRETYGGEAVRMAASIRLEMHGTGEWIKVSDGTVIGRVVGFKLTKSKVQGDAMFSCRVGIIRGVGISNVWTIFESLKRIGVIQVSSSWAAMNLDGEVMKFQGFNGLQRLCSEDPTLEDRLIKVYKGLNL